MCVVWRKLLPRKPVSLDGFFEAVPAWWGLRRTLWGGAPRAAAASGPVGGAGRGGGSVRTSLADYRA